jgi:hypothetical protein
MDVRKETTDAPGRHQWKEKPIFQEAATSCKREDNQRDLQEDNRAGDPEASSWDFQLVMLNDGLNIAEKSAPSKTEKETANGVLAGKCGNTGNSE